jgi:hypothetical protein
LDLRRLIGDILFVIGWRTIRLFLGESTFVTLRRGCRAMRCCRSNVHKEGLGIWGGTLCEIRHLPREDVGEEVFFLAAVGDLLSILVDSVIVELLSVELAVPLVPARRDVGRITGGIAV